MISEAKKEGLDVLVQIMAMDYGQNTPDMGHAAVQAAINTRKQLAKIYRIVARRSFNLFQGARSYRGI